MSHDAEAIGRTDREAPDREATDWLIRLGETDDVAVFEAFETWVTASPDHARAWAEVGAATRLIEAALPGLAIGARPAGDRRRRAARGDRSG
ncbi:MAG: DUF4880 domain-containing protein, partial [Caulobacter sp.]